MRKLSAILIIALLAVVCLVGCSGGQNYLDGEYSAEFMDFDNRGYKDFIHVTVKDGEVTDIEYNAVNKEGALKTEDSAYSDDMLTVQGTYPAKYSADLVNQYLKTQSIAEVDALAGATYSSESFIALFTSLEPNMASGETKLVLVKNIPNK